MRRGFSVEYRNGEDGFIVAECPQLPGCMSQGRTQKEAEKNIADAIEAVLRERKLQLEIVIRELDLLKINLLIFHPEKTAALEAITRTQEIVQEEWRKESEAPKEGR